MRLRPHMCVLSLIYTSTYMISVTTTPGSRPFDHLYFVRLTGLYLFRGDSIQFSAADFSSSTSYIPYVRTTSTHSTVSVPTSRFYKFRALAPPPSSFVPGQGDTSQSCLAPLLPCARRWRGEEEWADGHLTRRRKLVDPYINWLRIWGFFEMV